MFVVDDTDEIDGKEDAGVAMMRLFNFMIIDDGAKEALTLMTQVKWNHNGRKIFKKKKIFSVRCVEFE